MQENLHLLANPECCPKVFALFGAAAGSVSGGTGVFLPNLPCQQEHYIQGQPISVSTASSAHINTTEDEKACSQSYLHLLHDFEVRAEQLAQTCSVRTTYLLGRE
jgi:hypothetical protein